MKKLLLVTTLVVASVSLSGCVVVTESSLQRDEAQYDGKQREQDNRSTIAGLPMAAPVTDVKQQLGTPDFTDRWQHQQENIEVLYYRTRWVHGDGKTTRDECTPLVFVDGKLAGSGQLALDRVKKSR